MEEILSQQKETVLIMGIYGLLILAVLWYLQATQRRDHLKLTKNASLLGFIALAAAGLTFRLIMAYNLPGHRTDMFNFQAWATHSYEVGLDHFYEGGYYADYPPLYIYVLYLTGWIQSAFDLDPADGASYLLLRLPSIVAEIALAWIVYRTAIKRLNRNSALVLCSLILLNPATVINSSVWGQIDSLQVLMMIGVIWLLGERRLVAGSALFMLTFLIKLQAVMILPLLLFAYTYTIMRSDDRWRASGQVALSVGGMAVVWVVVALPFGIAGDPTWLVNKSMSSVGLYEYASLNALNIYTLFGLNWANMAHASFLGLGLSTWGYIFVVLICLWAAFLFWKRPEGWYLFALGALIIAAVYSVVHGMHERYAYPVPFFLLIAYILRRDRRLLASCILSFASVLLAEAMSMYCYPDAIPYAMLGAGSALTLGIFGYTVYVVAQLAYQEPVVQDLIEDKKEPAPKLSVLMKQRLREPAGWQRCDRKDTLIILVICAAYSLIAFSNLGTFDVPQTSTVLEEEAIIEFAESEHIERFKYYAGYGQGSFDVLWSQDGINYKPAELSRTDFTGSTIEHAAKRMYAWQSYMLDIEAKYIKFASVDSGLPMLEVGFFGPDGQPITPARVTVGGDEVTTWTDEQSIIPYESTYLTDFYFDEAFHVRTAYENIHGLTPYEDTHPPLGKILIAAGIQVFGMNSIGWRFMGTLAGVCMLPVMYVLARMLFQKRKYAVYAAILLAADGMHYAQTRIGTIDSYSVLWIMAMYLFMYRYAMTNFNCQPVGETLKPLFWCGLFFGLGAATKWLCLYAGAGLLIIYVHVMVQRHQEYVYAKRKRTYSDLVRNYKKRVTATLLWSILFFIVIPAAIYLVSYIPYMLVTDGGAYSFADILANQSYMLDYHANLNPDHVHGFASKWFTWPVDMRPVLFFHNQTEETVATLSTMGNPLVWWIGLVAAVSLALWAVRSRRVRTFNLLFLAVAALSEFVPWWFISREAFIYHYFAVVPFLILIIVYWLADLEQRFKWGRVFGYWVVGICATAFGFLYPVITGIPTPRDYINAIRWFETWPFY